MDQAVKAAKKPAKSKQAIAKDAQGYDAKPIPQTCGNCAHMASEKVLLGWMVRSNALSRTTRYTAEKDGVDKILRCSLGGFAVKKMATCSQFKPKDGA